MKTLLALMAGVVFSAGMAQADMVKLRNGTNVEGKVIEQTSDSVKVDIGGVTLTYYTDEVESVQMGETQAVQAAVKAEASAIPGDALDGLSKEQLIRKFVAIYGVKENMQANFDQMMTTLTADQAEAFRNAIKVDDIVEQLLPIYDKHFSDNDLRAYIRFYASAEGKKLVQSLPMLMKDSVDVSMKYLDVHLPDSLKQPSQPQQQSRS